MEECGGVVDGGALGPILPCVHRRPLHAHVAREDDSSAAALVHLPLQAAPSSVTTSAGQVGRSSSTARCTPPNPVSRTQCSTIVALHGACALNAPLCPPSMAPEPRIHEVVSAETEWLRTKGCNHRNLGAVFSGNMSARRVCNSSASLRSTCMLDPRRRGSIRPREEVSCPCACGRWFAGLAAC